MFRLNEVEHNGLRISHRHRESRQEHAEACPFPGRSDSLRAHLPSPQLQRERKQIGATQYLHNQEDARKGLRNAGKAGDRDGQVNDVASDDTGQEEQDRKSVV